MTSKKSSARKASLKRARRLGVVNVKMTNVDRKRLEQNARKFAHGNLSAWVRYAGRNHTPKRGEKVPLKVA